jgi:hypothetical protein
MIIGPALVYCAPVNLDLVHEPPRRDARRAEIDPQAIS